MRVLKRLFWCVGLTALVLLLFSPLVRGPENRAAPAEALPGGPTALYAAEAADIPLRAEAPARQFREALRETAAAPERLSPVPVTVCDRNGIPLTAATWAECGYLARPPEGMFG